MAMQTIGSSSTTRTRGMLAPRAWICGFDGSETESYCKRFSPFWI
jgi:hypothetical protein